MNGSVVSCLTKLFLGWLAVGLVVLVVASVLRPAMAKDPSQNGPTDKSRQDNRTERRQPDQGNNQPPRSNQTNRRENPPAPAGNSEPKGSARRHEPPPPASSDRGRSSDSRDHLEKGKHLDQGKASEEGKPPEKGKLPDKGRLPERGRPVQPDVKGIAGANQRRDMHEVRFADRVKTGDLDRLAKGATGTKLRLADQYRMYQQGDVARRLELEKHGRPAVFYHGVVSPAYQRSCLKYHYWGPRFFAGPCWYPLWSPWVEWSWHRHCNPYWDPRPIWCRPVVYLTCPGWTYWDTPVWSPLPVVGCGTWVGLRPVVLAGAQTDLQLVAVRFVDPGHPEQRTGPRYRVWFRNNGSQPVVQPFSVMLLASNDARLVPGLPQAGVRVTAIEAGDTQSVESGFPPKFTRWGAMPGQIRPRLPCCTSWLTRAGRRPT